jgi:hypothetical protein
MSTVNTNFFIIGLKVTEDLKMSEKERYEFAVQYANMLIAVQQKDAISQLTSAVWSIINPQQQIKDELSHIKEELRKINDTAYSTTNLSQIRDILNKVVI